VGSGRVEVCTWGSGMRLRISEQQEAAAVIHEDGLLVVDRQLPHLHQLAPRVRVLPCRTCACVALKASRLWATEHPGERGHESQVTSHESASPRVTGVGLERQPALQTPAGPGCGHESPVTSHKSRAPGAGLLPLCSDTENRETQCPESGGRWVNEWNHRALT